MKPTLNGADDETTGTKVDFGIVDAHDTALKHIQRFDIVSTYYPDSGDYNLETNTLKPSAKKKIKRVIAMPNETFKIEKGLLYVLKDNNYELIKYTFKTNPAVENNFEGKDTAEPITLKENEYWVLGDNREASRDCASINMPVKYENLFGVLVAIEGKGSLYIKAYACEACGKQYKSSLNGYCSKCGSALKAIYDVKNKQYQWPKYY